MKRIHLTLIALLFCLCSAVVFAGETRTIYVTRHGQVGDKNYWDKTLNEPWLTPLGREQATLLGNYLKKKGFHGTIYASPLLRTIETASLPATILGLKVIPEPGLQEIAQGKRPAPRGMTMKEMHQRFDKLNVIQANPAWVEPWRLCNEDADARYVRVSKAIDRILAETKGDLLFVSHGGTVNSANKVLNDRVSDPSLKTTGGVWNCCLFVYVMDENGKVVKTSYETFNYMPEDKATNNFRCPLIERPDDPRYQTKAQAKEASLKAKEAKRAAKKAKKKQQEAK